MVAPSFMPHLLFLHNQIARTRRNDQPIYADIFLIREKSYFLKKSDFIGFLEFGTAIRNATHKKPQKSSDICPAQSRYSQIFLH